MGGFVFEELFNLLCHQGLGPAARPVCELIAQLAGETMSLQQLKQEIRSVLARHGLARLTATVVSTLVELGIAGYVAGYDDDGSNEDAGAAVASGLPRLGSSPISDSVLLKDAGNAICANPRATKAVHETARGWLDIDGGIYVDVGQHGAGSDSEK